MRHQDEESPHTDVGAYVLGVLDPAGRTLFERHLRRCTRCRFEVREMSDVVRLLGAEPPPARRGDPQVRRRARRIVAAACAVVVIGLAGWAVADLVGTAPEDRPVASGTQDVVAERFTGTDDSTGVSGVVDVEETSWGTRFGLKLSGVRGPLRCRLVAVADDGTEQVAMSWAVPASGYGEGTADSLTFDGATALSRADLARVEVRTFAGKTLWSSQT